MIVDAHQHIGDLSNILSFDGKDAPPEPSIEEDANRRIARMDALGVSWAVLQPSNGYLRPEGNRDTHRLNVRMSDFRAHAPERFRVMGTTEPLYGQVGVDEVDRVHELGLDGLAWHHRFQGCYIDSKWMWPILERMGEHDLVPLFHVNAESSLEAPWRLQRLAHDFPDMTFLAMDGFWSYERARNILTTAWTTPNVIWDLGGPACYVSIQEWVERNGSKGLCFSDGGGYSVQGPVPKPPLLAQIEGMALADSDRADILGGNVARAFRALTNRN